MSEQTQTTIAFKDLPALGADLDGGEFAGITTKPDGTHWAVSKLPGYGEALKKVGQTVIIQGVMEPGKDLKAPVPLQVREVK